jgi:hypothetical protein
MQIMDSEIDRHYRNVGRVVVTASNLEAAIAQLIYTGNGGWDNTDSWLREAVTTATLKEGLRVVCDRFPGITALGEVRDALGDLLDRRNKLAHASVRYSFFETIDGHWQPRENPWEAQYVHPRSGNIGPLPTDYDVERLAGEMDALIEKCRKSEPRVAAAYAQLRT